MAYEMVMPYHLHMPSYFLETFTEYPKTKNADYDYSLNLRFFYCLWWMKLDRKFVKYIHQFSVYRLVVLYSFSERYINNLIIINTNHYITLSFQ